MVMFSLCIPRPRVAFDIDIAHHMLNCTILRGKLWVFLASAVMPHYVTITVMVEKPGT